MRQIADRARLERFMRELPKAATENTRVYFTGGATALLYGWRSTTIDVDIKLVPERDELFRALSSLKEQLQLNIELASPADFVPEAPGWEDRSIFVAQEGRLSFFHYDPYSQALAKIERGHSRDLEDVEQMIARALVEPEKLLRIFELIEPMLYRYPALNATSFRQAVGEVVHRY